MKTEPHAPITAAGAIFLALLGILDFVAWRQAASLRPPRLVNTSHQLFEPALLLVCIVVIAVSAFVFLLRNTIASRLVGFGLALGAATLFIWFQRFWLLGVFGFGGGRYWVHRAAQTSSDQDARSYLRVVLSATQYGVNIAENAVLKERNAAVQRRLFLLLADCAPNENWRQEYLDHANGWRRGEVQNRPAKERSPN